jgi:dextranase
MEKTPISASGAPRPRVRIMVVDDHEYVRRGLRALIEAVPEWTLCAEACGSAQALRIAERTKPDIVVLDLSMPKVGGLDLLIQLKPMLPAGRPVVLAAYLAPFRLDKEERALYCALITSFVIAANGASQLFLGEENCILTQGYYADHSVLTPRQIRRIRDYQDFFVRYQELLFSRELKDVTMTHCCWDNMEYSCDTPFSAYGETDKLWLTIRESTFIKLVAMVNLCGNSEDYWNRGKEKPKTLYGITFHILINGNVQDVFFATPDANGGRAVSLPFSVKETDRGLVLTVTVPSLEIGGLLWFQENEC